MADIKKYSLDEFTDKYIGKPGTEQRENYEYRLQLELLGEAIKTFANKNRSRKKSWRSENTDFENRK